MTVTLQQREGPGARAGWFFIAVVACVLFTTVMLVRSCEPAAPSESVPSGHATPATTGNRAQLT